MFVQHACSATGTNSTSLHVSILHQNSSFFNSILVYKQNFHAKVDLFYFSVI